MSSCPAASFSMSRCTLSTFLVLILGSGAMMNGALQQQINMWKSVFLNCTKYDFHFQQTTIESVRECYTDVAYDDTLVGMTN